MNAVAQSDDAGRLVRFGDVVRQVKDKVDPKTAGLDRYVAGEHMGTDDLRIRSSGTVGDGYLGPAFHMRFHPGQILYGSRRTYLRKVALADFAGICANTTFVIESATDALLPTFLPYVMTTDAFHQHSIKQSKGSVNPYVNFSDLSWYEFWLPTVSRQEEIVSLLKRADEVSESHRVALDAAEALLSSLILEHYTDASLAGELVPITELGELTMGRQKAPKYQAGDNPVPYLRVANIGSLAIDLTALETMDFTPNEVARYRLRPGDVLITEGDIVSARNVGRPAVFPDTDMECCFQNTLIRVRPHEGIDPVFVMTMLEGARLTGLLAAAAKTTTVSHLGLRRLATVELPFAPSTTQRQVRDQVENVLAVRSCLRDEVAAGKTVSRSLRNELLGGTAWSRERAEASRERDVH